MKETRMPAHGIVGSFGIVDAWRAGHIEIDPFHFEQVNPASYDLRLGNEVKELMSPQSGTTMRIDIRRPPSPEMYRTSKIGSEGMELLPGCLYLMHTMERVKTDRFVPVLDGKSSLGRFGIFVHATAGYGDPGYNGQYTLEVTVMYPTIVYAGAPFCQIRFHTLASEHYDYQDKGRYIGQQRGAQVSKGVK